MGKNFAVQFGNLIAKAGFTTRKSSMRLAEKTGKALVDLSKKSEKVPDKADIVHIFEENIPKRLRPNIITTKEECIPHIMKNMEMTEKEAARYINLFEDSAFTVSNDRHSTQIYLPLQILSKEKNIPAVVSHELVHLLEANRLKNKFIRILRPVLTNLLTEKKITELQDMVVHYDKLEELLINMPLKRDISCLLSSVESCNPNREQILKLLKHTPESLNAELKSLLEDFIKSGIKGKDNKEKYDFFIDSFDNEIFAYTVGGRVHEYEVGAEKTSIQTIRAFLYGEMKKVLEKEKNIYKKNKLLGRLQPGYRSEKDIFALAKNEEEQKFLQKICPSLSEQAKRKIYECVQIKPDYITCIAKKVGNPEFKNLLNLKTDTGAKVFDRIAQEALAQAPSEKIKEFAAIAGEKAADGTYKYKTLAYVINHPRFDLIKKIAEIEIGGKNPYAEYIGKLYILSAEEIEKMYKTLISSPADKKNIVNFLEILRKKDLTSTETEKIKCLFGV